jgi:hypothetical protein
MLTSEANKLEETPVTLDLDNLPDDPLLLHQLILDLIATNEKLRHRLKQLQRYQFGSKSERFAALEEQTLLFQQLRDLQEDDSQETDSSVETEEDKTDENAPRNNGKKKGHGRKPFPDHLPRKREEYPLPEDKCECPNCAGRLEKIGEEITRQLEYVPASFHVKELVRFKYAC